jgi:2-polyprenyl-3-methyl-5-hydroxy-6-metoxy-1,4-benzoquinol methylase
MESPQQFSQRRIDGGCVLKPFDVAQYWEDRLNKDYSLASVGRLNWGPIYNRFAYSIRRRIFLRWLRTFGKNFESADVLDIGTGTGFYVERWKELGVRSITGADLTEAAVKQLRAKFPNETFHQLNIGKPISGIVSEQFDFVSMMAVLFHIVDDEQYETAFKNIYSLLKPGGLFVFSELFLHGQTRRFNYLVHRSLDTIEKIYTDAGFEPVIRRPVFVLMNEPVDSTNRLLKLYWAILQRIVLRVPGAGILFGALYPIELALVSLLKESPATEFMICRKPV